MIDKIVSRLVSDGVVLPEMAGYFKQRLEAEMRRRTDALARLLAHTGDRAVLARVLSGSLKIMKSA